jgi:hypothetical protein
LALELQFDLKVILGLNTNGEPMKNTIKVVFGLLILSACAHHRDVRPGADGIHKVIVRGEDGEAGARDAISQANHYCEQQHKEAAFIEENKAYKGDMDEKTYHNTKTAAKVAKTVGGAAWVFGGRTESNLGGVVGLGGMAADAAAGNGYEVAMKFKCQ